MPRPKPASERKGKYPSDISRPDRNPTHSLYPMYPSAKTLPAPYPASDDIIGASKNYDLKMLGNLRMHALGFLSSLLENLTHKKALLACGMEWHRINLFVMVCPQFKALYDEVRKAVDVKKAMILEDVAFDKSVEGAKERLGYHPPSDTMHKVLLSGLIPSKYGKDTEQSAQNVQVNITI